MSKFDKQLDGIPYYEKDKAVYVCSYHLGLEQEGVMRMNDIVDKIKNKTGKILSHGICEECATKYFNN